MSEADTFIDSLDKEVVETETPKKRERKAKNADACAEVVSAKISLKLIKAAYINGTIVEPGSIVEVDQATADELLKPFDVQTTFIGYRYGEAPKEKIIRAERLN